MNTLPTTTEMKESALAAALSKFAASNLHEAAHTLEHSWMGGKNEAARGPRESLVSAARAADKAAGETYEIARALFIAAADCDEARAERALQEEMRLSLEGY